jgi:PilZ domain
MNRMDQRRHTRYPVRGIYGSLRYPRDVRVVNLSRSGVAFETAERLAAGEVCYLELRHQAEAASIEVAVRWAAAAQEHDDGVLYRVGASFVDVHRQGSGGLWAGIQPDPETPAAAS